MPTKKIQLISGFPQADFNQTDSTKSDYIKNKPTPLELDSDPSTGTEGYLGQLCINTATATTFICIGVVEGTYVWQKVPIKLSDLDADILLDAPRTTTITLLSDSWTQTVGEDGNTVANSWSQVVLQGNTDITEHSKVDLQPSAEQLTIFHEKDLTFVAENEDGVVTVFCVGKAPTNDYLIQATITEVVV
jgi:hypothetical protein